ncbi:MAG: AbrB/MazE/SpoVT family DNA-binding domain-containing protein [Candidatus Micrarchaeia archaeon]
MPRFEVVKLDSKGRVVVPQAFREMLGLKSDDKVFISLDEQNNRVIISPVNEKGLIVLEIALSDDPGSLAKAAGVLAKHGADLVSSHSRSTSRGKCAVWTLLCNASSVKDFPRLKKALKAKGAKEVKMRRL